MIENRNARSMGGKFWFLAIVIVTTLLLLTPAFRGSAAGAGGGGDCEGTYVIDLEKSEAIWMLSKDGAFQATDSAEVNTGFRHGHGAWTQTAGSKAIATWPAATHDPDTGIPEGDVRAFAEFSFEGGCDFLSGTFSLRLYRPNEDPQYPDAGSLIADDLSFSGRRVNP